MKSLQRSILLAFVATWTVAGASVAATSYSIDASHSSVIFRVMHKGITWNYGSFKEFSGSISVDEADPTKSTLEFEVKAASVDTNNAKRDDHLRGPDFFNVKESPTFTFKSTEVAPAGDKKYKVKGDLTMLGQTKPVDVMIEITGMTDDKSAAGALATFVVKRSEFGMSFGTPGVGDEVEVTVSIEAEKKG